MKLMQILNEDRSVFVVKTMGDKLKSAAEADQSYRGPTDAETIVEMLKKADPQNGTNIVFVARMYAKGQFKFEDVNRVKGDIDTYVKNKAKATVKDLNAFKDLSELYDAIAEINSKINPEGEKSKAAEVKDIKMKGAKYLINTPNFKAIQVTTHEAACFYGAGTKWCTIEKDDARFKGYSSQGDLIVLILPKEKKMNPITGQMAERKFQFHYESDQFMDEVDQSIANKPNEIKLLSKYPEYKDFLNMMIQKHYGDYIKGDKKTNESRNSSSINGLFEKLMYGTSVDSDYIVESDTAEGKLVKITTKSQLDKFVKRFSNSDRNYITPARDRQVYDTYTRDGNCFYGWEDPSGKGYLYSTMSGEMVDVSTDKPVSLSKFKNIPAIRDMLKKKNK
jgi:hypothetical protein